MRTRFAASSLVAALAFSLSVVPAAGAADAGDDTADVSEGSHCAPPTDMKADQTEAYVAACTFFTAVAARDINALMPTVQAPFFFEGVSVASIDDVGRRWARLLGDLGNAPAPFYGMSLYTYDDMVKKYGKPPAKLSDVPLRGALIAVADIDGRAEVAVVKRQGKSWAVFAFHD